MIDLEFNHVSKSYVVQSDAADAERETNPLVRQWRRFRPRSESFLAVSDVSFQIKRGEAVGIIGHNGAGKSTIFKLLSNITAPTKGEITIKGRLSALIEVGSGFHPELSGRENIFLSGSILGMRRREISAKLDKIIDFAGVRRFIDTPVKRYSSGMYVRLGFAIAAHLDPDILLLDEVLAVGDAAFQAKCGDRIKELENSGTTIVFISHDMVAVERLCQRVILMQHGKIAAQGLSADVIKAYHNAAEALPLPPVSRMPAALREWNDINTAPGDSAVRLRRVRVRTAEGFESKLFDIHEPIGIESTYDVMEGGHVLVPNFHFIASNGICLFSLQDVQSEWRRTPRAPGRYTSTVWIPGNFLADGRISVHAGIGSHFPSERVHLFELNAVAFEVVESLTGDTARGDYRGEFPGMLRPILSWTTQFVDGTLLHEANINSPAPV